MQSANLAVEDSADLAPKSVVPPQLQRYTFKAGALNPARYNPLAHRQKGTLNSTTILYKAAPKLAKKYVKKALTGEGDTAILIDARKWILPVDGDASEAGATKVLVFIGSGTLPAQPDMPILDAAADPPTTRVDA